jgi:FkbM family methyltransferase
LTKSNKYSKLFNQRVSSEISREHYWSQIREFLEELTEFSQLQDTLENRIEIFESQIIVNLRTTRTHKSYIKMLLDDQDVRSVPFSVLADGLHEPFQADILVELGKNSTHFLDIGANMGFYSLTLLAENPTLTVESFEPQPKVFAKLSKNIHLNNFSSRIEIHNTGLGSAKGELTMYIPKFTGTGGGSFKNLHDDEGEATQIKVPVNVLDEALKKHPDLIKIDVEGSELNVILGADKIIDLLKPTIMVELLRKWMKPFGHTPQMFIDKMFKQNYICYAISTGKLSEIDKIDENTVETNFIFVHETQHKHMIVLERYTN